MCIYICTYKVMRKRTRENVCTREWLCINLAWQLQNDCTWVITRWRRSAIWTGRTVEPMRRKISAGFSTGKRHSVRIHNFVCMHSWRVVEFWSRDLNQDCWGSHFWMWCASWPQWSWWETCSSGSPRPPAWKWTSRYELVLQHFLPTKNLWLTRKPCSTQIMF